MIKYNLFFDNSGICEKREPLTLGETLTLTFFGGEGVRVGIVGEAGGEKFFSVRDGACRICTASLEEGENRVTVYGKSKRWKCESLIKKGDVITPAGVDCAEQISLFKSKYESIFTRLAMCEARLCALENQINQKSLF
jgi:hypothetical protein